MKKNPYWLVLTTIVMLSIAMASVGTASPAEPAIHVKPKDNTAEVGETFTVNIAVTDITEEENLYLWECRITFNPDIINAVNATEGPFLKDTGCETFWAKKMNNTIGTVDILATISEFPYPPNGATGSGTLATITFEAVGQGATDLEFKEEDDTRLRTIKGEAPDQYVYPIPHDRENGSFRNAGAPIPLQLVAAIVVVVAACIFAVFYFRRKRA
jgi:hypothetical protein